MRKAISMVLAAGMIWGALAFSLIGHPGAEGQEAAGGVDLRNMGQKTFVDGKPHNVTFDKYSLMIDGQRIMIIGGEFHYWRLPSPEYGT